MTPSDLSGLTLVDDPRIAPDGSAIVYAVATSDLAKNVTRSRLWIAERDQEPRAFTAGPNDRAARWSPDGRWLAFIGDRGEGTKVFVIARDGGEARAVSDAHPRIGAPVWSPDGRRIAASAVVDFDPLTAHVALDEVTQARHITALPYKSDSLGLADGKHAHLIVLDAHPQDAPVCEIVTSGDFDAGEPSWFPLGDALAFIARIGGDDDTALTSNVWRVALASRELVCLTTTAGSYSSATVSPDGTQVAFIGVAGDDVGGRFNARLWVVPTRGGHATDVSADLDRSIGDLVISDLRAHPPVPPAWTPDGKAILTLVSDRGATAIRRFTLAGENTTVAGGDREIFAFTAASDGTLAFAYTTPVLPCAIARVSPDGDEREVARPNADWLLHDPPREPRRIAPVADDGVALDAWILEADAPADCSAPPIVLAVHGGPHAAYGLAYFFEFQLLADLGYTVVFGNPRGSQSYGHAYANGIHGDWGGRDVKDLHTILDAALDTVNVDRKRIGVQGGSYGGVMTTTLAGTSDRFAAAISMRSVNDHLSFSGATDIPRFIENELNVRPVVDAQKLFERSPIRHVEGIRAPFLVMHSERDFRCPIDQGEQLFNQLRLLGRTAEFVRFTGDGHDLSRNGSPRNRLLRLRAIVHWFNRYLLRSEREGSTAAGWLFAPLPGEPEPAAATA